MRSSKEQSNGSYPRIPMPSFQSPSGGGAKPKKTDNTGILLHRPHSLRCRLTVEWASDLRSNSSVTSLRRLEGSGLRKQSARRAEFFPCPDSFSDFLPFPGRTSRRLRLKREQKSPLRLLPTDAALAKVPLTVLALVEASIKNQGFAIPTAFAFLFNVCDQQIAVKGLSTTQDAAVILLHHLVPRQVLSIRPSQGRCREDGFHLSPWDFANSLGQLPFVDGHKLRHIRDGITV